MTLGKYTIEEQGMIDYCYTKFFWTAKSVKEYRLSVTAELNRMKKLGYGGYRSNLDEWCEGVKAQLAYEKVCKIKR